MRTLVKRFLVSVFLALLAGSFAFASANAQTPIPPVPATPSGDCASCHPERHAAWAKGAHGAAKTTHVLEQASNCLACHKTIPDGTMSEAANPAQTNFADAWQGQGKPPACLQCHATGYDPVTGTAKADGITCEACHSPMAPDHPKKDEPINLSTDLCRTCHTDSRFGWDTWQASVHFQRNLTCTTCHDPHTTDLKMSDPAKSDPSSLCINCHKNVAKDAQHSKHTEAGVTCVDCHLGPKKGTDDFHKVPDHSFTPKIETCNGCHEQQMHGAGVASTGKLTDANITSPTQVASAPTKQVENIQASVKNGSVSALPPAPNTTAFAGMAIFLGVVIGMVVSLARRR